jgi:hypothetical protein
MPEVDFDNLLTFGGGIDPDNPGAIGSTPNKIDPDFGADMDYEALFGLDRELIPDLAVGAAFTWRRTSDLAWYPFIGVTTADYELGESVTTDGYTSQGYILKDGVMDRPEVTGGDILVNKPDYNRTYKGIELTMNKRLSNKWMTRVAFSWGDWRENYNGPDSIQNPYHARDGFVNIDGGKVIRRSSGSGNGYFTTASWQLNISGLYQLPAGFDISGNLYTRQGYPQPLYHRIYQGPLDGTDDVLAVNAVDDVRLDKIFNLDLRVGKNFVFGRRSATLAFELFNALNGNTNLNRYINLSSSASGRLEEIMAPRIGRLVFRLRF